MAQDDVPPDAPSQGEVPPDKVLKKLPAKKAAKEIQELRNKGKTHEEIVAERPDLADGWDVAVKAESARRKPRGGGSYEPIGSPAAPRA